MSSSMATTKGDLQVKLEAHTKSTSSPFRNPETARTKTDAQFTYRVRYGRTWYGWKDNLKTLPMELVLGPNSSGVDRNHLRKLTSSFYSGAAMPFFGLWAVYRVRAH